MSRITNKDLERAVSRLNSYSKRKYRIHGAYGKVQLVVESLRYPTAVSIITPFVSKRELYNIIHSIIEYILAENKVK